MAVSIMGLFTLLELGTSKNDIPVDHDLPTLTVNGLQGSARQLELCCTCTYGINTFRYL
jgi:hypothetical protein